MLSHHIFVFHQVPEQARAAPRIQDADTTFDELWKTKGEAASQVEDDNCFACEATLVTSKNLQNLKCIFDYKCIVSAGERCFLLGLGVSWLGVYLWHAMAL